MLEQPLRESPALLLHDEWSARDRWSLECLEDRVGLDGFVSGKTHGIAVLGYVADAGSKERTGIRIRQIGPPDRDLPGGDLAKPGQRLRKLPLTVSGHAGDSDDLAGSDGQRCPLESEAAVVVERKEVVRDEDRLAGARASCRAHSV